MPQTFVEKIFSRDAGREVRAGEIVTAKPDHLLTHDNTAAIVGKVEKELAAQGVIVRSETRNGILEEVPEAYKDVDEVIEVVERAGLARKVARLLPLICVKG